MTSQYRHRRTSSPSTAFPTPLEPGEISVNTANRQLAVGDAASATIGAPLPLLAVRYFDARAIYAAGEMVVNNNNIYRANAANGPGAFNPTQWDSIAGTALPSMVNPLMDGVAAPGASLLYARQDHVHPSDSSRVAKAGDTMTGTLTVAQITGGSAPGSSVTIQSTTNASPSGDSITLRSQSGSSNVNVGVANVTGGQLTIAGFTGGAQVLKADSTGVASGTVSLFPGTDTIVGLSATQTLANKTLASPTLSGTIAGSATFSGVITATAKGHTLGVAGGASANTAVTPADANIKLYDFGGGNWQGMGADASGSFWLRVGLSGSPVPAFWISTDQVAHFTASPQAPTPSAGDNSNKLATTQYVDASAGGMPSGTVMLFYQAAAPVGWTKVTTQNDKALRVVSGSGGVPGGTNSFSSVMAQTVVGNTTLDASQLPSVTSYGANTINVYINGDGNWYMPVGYASGWGGTGGTFGAGGSAQYAWNGASVSYANLSQGAAGISVASNNTGGGAHNHGITMAIQYIDLILASKN